MGTDLLTFPGVSVGAGPGWKGENQQGQRLVEGHGVFHKHSGFLGWREDKVSHLPSGLGDSLQLIIKCLNGSLPALGIPASFLLVPFLELSFEVKVVN